MTNYHSDTHEHIVSPESVTEKIVRVYFNTGFNINKICHKNDVGLSISVINKKN